MKLNGVYHKGALDHFPLHLAVGESLGPRRWRGLLRLRQIPSGAAQSAIRKTTGSISPGPSSTGRSMPTVGSMIPTRRQVTCSITTLWARRCSGRRVPGSGPLRLTEALGKAVRLSVKADGFSLPYLLAGALATALYGFLGLCVSFGLARRYVGDTWAFLATLGMWFASSLPVYLYFNPFYSHAHSVFAAAVFLWYWQRTRPQRSLAQWAILGSSLAGTTC